MSNTINPILIVFIVLLVGALGLSNQALHQSNTLVIKLQENKDTVFVEVHDTVVIETKVTEAKPDYIDYTPLIGKKIYEITDSTELGFKFYVELTSRLMARGYLPNEGAWTTRMIHDAFNTAMSDYVMPDTISRDMLIAFGMYTN